MDLNLNTLIGITYLLPIAITLRTIYTPSFDTPEPISMAVAKLDTSLGPHAVAAVDASRGRNRRR